MTPYEILVQNKNYAVIGLSDDYTSFSNKIYKLLKNKGKRAYGINPRLSSLDDDKVYASLAEITDPVDVAVFVVNPRIGLAYLDQVKDKGIEHVWLQPGTISDEVLERAKELDLNVIQSCVLVEYAHNESN